MSWLSGGTGFPDLCATMATGYVRWFGVCVMEMATDGNGLLILFESNELAELQLGLKDGF